MEIVRLHLANIKGLNGIPVHGFVINTHLHFDHCGQNAAYTADIYEAGDAADPSNWGGQYSDRNAWGSLRRLREMKPSAVHFCHDTRVSRPRVSGHR